MKVLLMMIKKAFYIILIFALPLTAPGQKTYECLFRAKALMSKGASDQAISLITSALETNKDQKLLLARAGAYMSDGRYQEAIADLNEANSISPNSGEYGLACVYARKGDAATSLYHLELNLKSAERKSEKEIMLNSDFDRIGNTPEWRSFWKRDWYTDLDEGVSEIEYYVSARKSGEARTVYTEISRKYPDNQNVQYAKSLIDISEGRYSEAIKALNGLLISAADNDKFLAAMARAQFLSSNFAGASATYSRLMELGTPDTLLLISRAECYMKTGETDKARDDIGKFLSVYPENKTALRVAGKIETSDGKTIKALDYFSLNLRLHPSDPECYIDRANTYMLSKSWIYAINDYSMSLDIDPENAEAWLNKGLSLANSGKTEDACHDFRASLRLGNKRATEYISKYCFK